MLAAVGGFLKGVSPFLSSITNIGSLASSIFHDKKNTELQKDFAQQGIRWKVADAKAAGIHPLAALGASTMSYQPADSAIPEIAQDLGQNITRAVHQTRTQREREEALSKLALEKSELDNALIRSQIKLTDSQVGGSLPSGRPYSFDSPDLTKYGVDVQPTQTTPSEKGFPGKETGSHPSYTYLAQDDGSLQLVPSTQAKQLTEDSFFLELPWFVNNGLLPSFKRDEQGGPPKPPKHLWAKGAIDYEWVPIRMSWVPVYKKPKKKPTWGSLIRGLKDRYGTPSNPKFR